MSYTKLTKIPPGSVHEVSTDSEMTAALVAANMNKAYKFTGTTGTYTNGDLYIVEFAMPAKGSLITMDLGNAAPAAGVNNTYRVLKTSGTYAEVLAMYFPSSSTKWDYSYPYSYNNGTLDSYLNTTFYNSLNSTAQTAIVAQSTDTYYYDYSGGTHPASSIPYSSKTFIQNIGNRYIYALSFEDIVNYFGTTEFSTTELSDFYTSSGTTCRVWLRDQANSSSSSMACCISVDNIRYKYCDNAQYVQPMFTIDLTKIAYSAA